jgi:hypothetical protein
MWKRLSVAIAAAALCVACSSSSSGGGTTCTSTTACSNGLTMQACAVTDSTGACSSLSYVVGSQTFACASCTDPVCGVLAERACGIDASLPADAEVPVEASVDTGAASADTGAANPGDAAARD